MSIVSTQFLAFVSISIVLFYVAPKKIRWFVLLAASLGFYAYSGPKYLIYILYSSAVSYLTALVMSKNNRLCKQAVKTIEEKSEKKAIKEKFSKKNRRFLTLGVFLVLLELVAVKYLTFIVTSLNVAANHFGFNEFSVTALAAPLGCSFFSLTIIGYLADVYRGRAEAQKNYLKYLLFVSYFPQIIQGPIARYNQLSPQFFTPKKLNYDRFRNGLLRVIWGIFKKLTIAEVIAPLVSKVYNNYTDYTGAVILLVTVFFSIQIYADFSGYVDIVSGISELFGISLAENFRRPYLSRTIPEFWRRWHISLSSWFKEYVFYAFSSSKMMLKLNKGTRKIFGNAVGRIISVIIPVLFVWMLTGLWHGASWNYVAWGLFHGVLIMLSIIFTPHFNSIENKLNVKTDSFSWNLMQIVRTFMLCTIGRVFFRATCMRDALGIFKIMFTRFDTLNGFYSIALNKSQLTTLFVAIIIMLAVSLITEHFGSFTEWFSKQNVWFRWIVIYGLVLFILCFGSYGPNASTSFIYEQF